MGSRQRVARYAGVSLAAVAFALSACGYAKKKDMEAQMAQLRQEMNSGDQAVSSKVDAVNGRVDSLSTALTAMQTDFNAKITKLQGLLAFDVPVHFDFNSADVRSDDEGVLRRFAGIVKDYYPNAVVTVEGFTDPAGSRAYNMKLGMKRAESVKAFLVSQGQLDDAQVRTVSYGETKDREVIPGAKGPGEDGIQNRRVALVIDYSGDALPPPPPPKVASHKIAGKAGL
jgi:peptidoglycan-associated lipoprotein